MDQATATDYRDRFLTRLSQNSPGRKEFVVASASGCHVTDAEGRSYLDMTSGIGVANVGHCHPDVVAAVQAQVARYAHVNVYGRFVVPEQVEIVDRLVAAAGPGFDMAYLLSTGAEANECALKLARKLTGRPTFVAFEQSYHGRSFGALSVSWREEWRAPFEPLLPDVQFVPFGDTAAAAAAVDERTAAVIVEPIQGEGGIRIPPDDFLAGLRAACDRAGALLIADEVQGGMGRSGRWFAHQHWDVRPDVITTAKATGGGLPLAAVLSTAARFATFADPPLSHLTTMGGNPVACAAGIAAYDVIVEDDLLANATAMGERLRSGLRALMPTHPGLVVDVRGKGLWCALEIDGDADLLARMMQERGVLVGSVLNRSGTVRIMPPLVIGPAEVDLFLTTVGEALGELTLRTGLSR